jgi:hypothetical protein
MPTFMLALLVAVCLGCSQSEVKGTYDVELILAGVPRPHSGTLILSTRTLDIPFVSGTGPGVDSGWFGGESNSANSCFILLSPQTPQTGVEIAPDVVHIFEALIQPRGVDTPIEIVRAGGVRIEIVKLQFFANALGGELELHTVNGVRPGRIRGTRIGDAQPQRCVDAVSSLVSSAG